MNAGSFIKLYGGFYFSLALLSLASTFTLFKVILLMNAYEKSLLKAIDVDPEDFEYDFGSNTVMRGIKYSKQSKVHANYSLSKLEGDDLVIEGHIEGSGHNVYFCEVKIFRGLFETTIASECGCPVGIDCKHGVALLFYHLHSQNRALQKPEILTDEDRIEQWLSFIKGQEIELENSSNEKTAFENTSSQYQVIYILEFLTSNNDFEETGLALSVYKSKWLKKGGFGKEYKLKFFHEIEVDNRYENLHCTYLDEDIATALQGLRTSGNYGYDLHANFYLSGEYGETVLKQVLKTGRCFWETQKSLPLKEGLPREIELFWREKGGALIPAFKTEPKCEGIYRIERFYYHDNKVHEFGMLTNKTLSDDQIIYLMEAPPIPKKMADEVSEQLLAILPDVSLPLPGNSHLEQVEIKTSPVCHLKLHAVSVTVDDGRSRLLHLASLSFHYDDIVVKPVTQKDLSRAVTIKLRDKVRYTIFHDTDYQNESISRLYQAGLQSMIPEQSPYGVMDMAMFGEITIEESVQMWDSFRLETLPELEAEGWNVSIDESFSLEVESIDEWYGELEETDTADWFEMSLGFELNGKKINILPLVVALISRHKTTQALQQSLKEKDVELLQIGDYQWVKIPTKRLLLILDTVIELYDSTSLNKEGNLEFSKHSALHYGDLLNDPKLCWKGADELKALNDKLTNFTEIQSINPPKKLKAELRDYQKIGYDWMQFLREYQLNGILADDMGLGKTLQALTCLLLEKQAGRASLPSLVIAPTSLMSNWKNEIKKFTPDIRVLILQGPDRKEKFSQIEDYDLILTTYPLMIRDTDIYTEQAFHYLMLDEAQAIKNAKSKTTQIIFKIKANHRLCITGTPIENHLGELWSMFHFIMPGYLGTHEKFTKLFRSPIEKNGDVTRSDQLRKRIQPFMLRRTKELVAKELPKKTEIIRSVPLTGKQRDLYETVRLAMDKKVRDEISKKGLARSHIMILDALLKLRQVCCDPQLVKLAKAKNVKESAKLTMLMEMVPEMVDEGRKILIFSQFTSMLSIIENALVKEKISFTKLTGQTRKRAEAISAFQEGDAKVFLISLKAGGVGLNLTAADTVIHYDPWWNPAVENQATDRAHRLGQDKPVFVYKLLTEDTVEEKILQLQEKKKNIADSMYKGTGGKRLAIEQGDLMNLLKPME